MKYYNNRMTVIVKEYIGTATADDGTEINLYVTIRTCMPIITFPNGEAVVFEWIDLIELAQKYIKENERSDINA